MKYLAQYDLTGKTALVTGGTRGIGFACAVALGECGAAVKIVSSTADAGQQAAEELTAKGIDAEYSQLDVTDSQAVSALAAKLNSDGRQLDILVANAGIAIPSTPTVEISDANWLHVLDVNLNGLFWCCREFGRYMLERQQGSIVTVGSMSGLAVNKPQIQPHYNASKAAVHQLTKSLAAEWAPRGVRINAVAPTYIDTPMCEQGKVNKPMYDQWMAGTPMNRMGTSEEVASAVLFLACDASSLMTGATMLTDGGYTCW